MKIKFQADNDFNGRIIRTVQQLAPNIDFRTAPAAGFHLGTPDERILEVAAQEGRLLVSHDRKTMPTHFANFIASQSSPGVFIVSRKLTIARAAEWLILYWAASDAEEHINMLTYIP
jgi:hypothetical protein